MHHAGFRIFVLGMMTAALALGACSPFSPRRSSETLRENLLNDVPLGSSMQQVQEQVNRLGWKVEVISLEHGFHNQGSKPSVTTGVKHIEAYAGRYQGVPWEADVSVYWGFDAQGQLIDVWVWKTYNSL